MYVGIFVKISVNNNDLNIDQIRERGGLCPLNTNTTPIPETYADSIANVISPSSPSSPFLEENFLERCNSYSCCERTNKGMYLRTYDDRKESDICFCYLVFCTYCYYHLFFNYSSHHYYHNYH